MYIIVIREGTVYIGFSAEESAVGLVSFYTIIVNKMPGSRSRSRDRRRSDSRRERRSCSRKRRSDSSPRRERSSSGTFGKKDEARVDQAEDQAQADEPMDQEEEPKFCPYCAGSAADKEIEKVGDYRWSCKKCETVFELWSVDNDHYDDQNQYEEDQDYDSEDEDYDSEEEEYESEDADEGSEEQEEDLSSSAPGKSVVYCTSCESSDCHVTEETAGLEHIYQCQDCDNVFEA